MRAGWTRSVTAVVAGMALMGAGVALAKAHEDHGGRGRGGKHGDGSPGHGGEHGKPDDGETGKGRGPGGSEGPGASGKPDKPDKPGKGGGGSCDLAASSAIMAFVDAECPCAGIDDGNGGTIAWKNHGRYVRCVAHAVKDASRAAGVKRRCVRDLVPCAARSSCGKRGAVTCLVATSGTCTNGACDDEAASPCTTDADCGGSACSVVRADRCTEAGGTVGTGSCCTASPSGAFLD